MQSCTLHQVLACPPLILMRFTHMHSTHTHTQPMHPYKEGPGTVGSGGAHVHSMCVLVHCGGVFRAGAVVC